MVKMQRKLKANLKRELVAQAGGKCANPGCASWSRHIHHIKHWAVYKNHNASDMIALCPTCHDLAHHGTLKITDQALYDWKRISRQGARQTAHLYVEPAQDVLLLTGTVCVVAPLGRVTVFSLSNGNYLELRVLDGDLLQVSSRLLNLTGTEVHRVVENHVRVAIDPAVEFDQRPGRVRILAPATLEYLPEWLLGQIQTRAHGFVVDGKYVALDLEVVRPGVVRITGC